VLQMSMAFIGTTFSTTIPRMFLRGVIRIGVSIIILFAVALVFSSPRPAQHAPSASGARILLLPRRIISGERATLAVLDVSGRLTPGVTVSFSNGDKLTTNATGRALFVAPLNLGVMFASIVGRPGRVTTAILSADEASSASIDVASAPRFASLTDRFELLGRGFCGDADANHVTIGGQPALVLAASPVSLVDLPPLDMGPGTAAVEISCAKRQSPPLTVTFVALELESDSSPMKSGEHRGLAVHVRGTTAKIALEARNLAPEVADLSGGNTVRLSSSGGAENVARFDLIARKNGSFMISIRLVSSLGRPQ
jgi:hypothetical protein